MLFDRPVSLPTATVHSSSHLTTFANHLRGTRDRSWRWMQPRLVPLMVALVGMLAVLGSAEYLTHLARHTPVAEVQPVTIEQPAILVDGKSSSALGRMQLPTAQPVRVIVLSGQ